MLFMIDDVIVKHLLKFSLSITTAATTTIPFLITSFSTFSRAQECENLVDITCHCRHHHHGCCTIWKLWKLFHFFSKRVLIKLIKSACEISALTWKLVTPGFIIFNGLFIRPYGRSHHTAIISSNKGFNYAIKFRKLMLTTHNSRKLHGILINFPYQ